MKKTPLLVLVVATTVLTACSSDPSVRRGIGTATGAGLGAAIGHGLDDDDWVEPVIGAAVGAGLGFAYGEVENRAEENAYISGYQKGRSDEVKNLYWAKRRAHEEGLGDQVDYTYYEIPVGEHKTRDGVIIEGNTQVIEVVE